MYWTKEKTIEEARKYSTRTEFCKRAKGAYVAASKHGWLDEMPWLNPTRRTRWTKEDAMEEASKYCTLHDFIKGSQGAYQSSLNHGWLNDMTWLKNDWKTWTKKSVIEESHKYSSRTEFARKSVGAYMFAKKHDMLDDMTWLPLKIHARWTKEECIEESKKYSTRKEFSEKSSGAYTAAFDNGWINEMTWLEVLTRPAWTKEECIEESKKYASRSEFQNKSKGAYLAARSKGWLDDMPWLKSPVLGKLPQKSVHCVYVYLDEENRACYVGRTNRLKRRDKEHRNPYNPDKPDSLKKYFDALGMEIPQPVVLKEKLLPTESQYWEDYYLNEYRQNDYQIINRGKTGVNVGSLGGGFIKWDRESTFLEGKKYKTFGQFYQANASAYQVAKKYKWLDEMTWLEYDQMPNGYWTKERVIEESKKYSSRVEMEAGSPAAYGAALKNGWSSDLPLKYKRVGKDYYTKEKVFELSKECSKRVEFKTKYSRAYVIARKNGWLDEMPWLRRTKKKNSD